MKFYQSIWAIVLSLSWSQVVWGGQGMLLDCAREGGYSELQIYIDLEQNYVLYNAQLRTNGDFGRSREYDLVSASGERTLKRDEAMDVSIHNDFVVEASGGQSSFVISKSTGSFAYAWTGILPPGQDGRIYTYGNHHQGTCGKVPFVGSEQDPE